MSTATLIKYTRRYCLIPFLFCATDMPAAQPDVVKVVNFEEALPEKKVTPEIPPEVSPKLPVKVTGKVPLPGQQPRQARELQESSNLPYPLTNRNFTRLETTASQVVLPQKGARELLERLHAGDEIPIEITHSVIAFPDEKAPVLAVVTEGPMEKAKLIGNSRLEPNSQRIFLEFDRISLRGTTFSLRASAVTTDGQTGFVGEFHSQEGQYFAGDFISSMVAGYFDGLVPRYQNPYGQVVSDNSVDAAAKKGLAAGAMSSAERFREKLKKVPQFSELKGPFPARALILEQAFTIPGDARPASGHHKPKQFDRQTPKTKGEVGYESHC